MRIISLFGLRRSASRSQHSFIHNSKSVAKMSEAKMIVAKTTVAKTSLVFKKLSNFLRSNLRVS